ncbi:MAG TPA: hypothetical protein VMZ27_11900 [Candidatus Saccharimonadales bacterium]|nr:hypothetical protein [Candidatus Saccharimonadales bacterium]
MKRSQKVILVLSGALATSTIGCNRNGGWGDDSSWLSSDNTYTNNHYVHGVGYYHAPYHAWFPYPYNSYQIGRGYYHGGTWSPEPNASPTTVSRPSVQATSSARSAYHSTTTRGGFGSSSRSGIS